MSLVAPSLCNRLCNRLDHTSGFLLIRSSPVGPEESARLGERLEGLPLVQQPDVGVEFHGQVHPAVSHHPHRDPGVDVPLREVGTEALAEGVDIYLVAPLVHLRDARLANQPIQNARQAVSSAGADSRSPTRPVPAW